jgi:hypothetical protein
LGEKLYSRRRLLTKDQLEWEAIEAVEDDDDDLVPNFLASADIAGATCFVPIEAAVDVDASTGSNGGYELKFGSLSGSKLNREDLLSCFFT